MGKTVWLITEMIVFSINASSFRAGVIKTYGTRFELVFLSMGYGWS
jgi:hypothetical protein